MPINFKLLAKDFVSLTVIEYHSQLAHHSQCVESIAPHTKHITIRTLPQTLHHN